MFRILLLFFSFTKRRYISTGLKTHSTITTNKTTGNVPGNNSIRNSMACKKHSTQVLQTKLL